MRMMSFDSKSDDSGIMNLNEYRRSPSPGVNASRPKYQITTPSGDVYFKFQLTNNEIGAEIFSFHIADKLGIPIAKTCLATYKNTVGIASFDIGDYSEPDDSESYSVMNFTHIDGFVEMCLFDYLIMNEDRHGGNWGIYNNSVAPLYDHNNCFGGAEGFADLDHFMVTVTSALYVSNEYECRHDAILKYLTANYRENVFRFVDKLDSLGSIEDAAFISYDKEHSDRLNYILKRRIEYMKMKVGEFCG